jgi:hypothetical protein
MPEISDHHAATLTRRPQFSGQTIKVASRSAGHHQFGMVCTQVMYLGSPRGSLGCNMKLIRNDRKLVIFRD